MSCRAGDKSPEKNAVWKAKSMAMLRLLSNVRCAKAYLCSPSNESTKWLESIITAAYFTKVGKESPFQRKGDAFEIQIF